MTTAVDRWLDSPARARILAAIETLDVLLGLGPNPHAEGMVAGLRLAITEVRDEAAKEDGGRWRASPERLARLAAAAEPLQESTAVGLTAGGEPLAPLDGLPAIDGVPEAAPPPPAPMAVVPRAVPNYLAAPLPAPPVPAPPAAGAAPAGAVDTLQNPAESTPRFSRASDQAAPAAPDAGKRPHWTQLEKPEDRDRRIRAMVEAKAAKREGRAPVAVDLVPREDAEANLVAPAPPPLPTTEPPTPVSRNFAPAPDPASLGRLKAVGPMAPAAVGGVLEVPSLGAERPEVADAAVLSKQDRARALLRDGKEEMLVSAEVRLPLREVFRLAGEVRREKRG